MLSSPDPVRIFFHVLSLSKRELRYYFPRSVQSTRTTVGFFVLIDNLLNKWLKDKERKKETMGKYAGEDITKSSR